MTIQIFRRVLVNFTAPDLEAPNVSLDTIPFMIFEGSNKVFLYDRVDPSLAATYPAPEYVGESFWQVGDILVFQNGNELGSYPGAGVLFEGMNAEGNPEHFIEFQENMTEFTEENPPWAFLGQNLRGGATDVDGTFIVPSDPNFKPIDPNFTFVARVVAVDAITYNELNPSSPTSVLTLDRVYRDPNGPTDIDILIPETNEVDYSDTVNFRWMAADMDPELVQYTDGSGNVVEEFYTPNQKFARGNLAIIRGAEGFVLGDNQELWDTATILDNTSSTRERGIRAPGIHNVRTITYQNGNERTISECLQVVKLRSDENAADPVEINDFYVIDLPAAP